MNTEAIINGIRSKDSETIKHIYRNTFGSIRNYICTNNGTEEDAKEIIQESLIIAMDKVSQDGFYLSCSFKTYFHSICKHLWLNEIRRRSTKNVQFCDCDQYASENKEYNPEIESKKRRIFRFHWNELSKDCKKILSLYFKSTPMKEIKEIMGYSSDQYTWNKKFKCKKKLNERIVTNPEYKEIRNELH